MRLDKRTWSFLDSLRSRAMTPKLLVPSLSVLLPRKASQAVVPGLDLGPIMTTSNVHCPESPEKGSGQGTARDVRQPPLFRPTCPPAAPLSTKCLPSTTLVLDSVIDDHFTRPDPWLTDLCASATEFLLSLMNIPRCFAGCPDETELAMKVVV